ncbi:MAG: hypothetical protein A3G75_02755 [Verrucomicrobia bacterium RIFCSPLOWO2_12_FULL_64_8]|nr:MAG: hypothetical protein A3G75_02755 [Verrucomicrobia bacterium RIFCSPLOWO2_12_FULL_64_8]
MPQSVVAVIDIGSNSIKSLVARPAAAGGLEVLGGGAREARISTGLSRARPQLTAEGMQRGVDAIGELLAEIAPFEPGRVVIVATSAVRDATNGPDFCARVRAATGTDVRILAGGDEASLIGRGLTSDPALADLQDFYVFDLGGGSLECLAFRARRVEQAASLPLGCVRLTEKYVADVRRPFSAAEQRSVVELVREVLVKSGFRFRLPAGAVAVATGGTVTTARAILAARLGRPIGGVAPVLTVEALRELLAVAARLPLEQRRTIPGLPPPRADIFPTALATVLALAEAGGFAAFRHSFHNLRYGVAAELLEIGR